MKNLKYSGRNKTSDEIFKKMWGNMDSNSTIVAKEVIYDVWFKQYIPTTFSRAEFNASELREWIDKNHWKIQKFATKKDDWTGKTIAYVWLGANNFR